VALQQREVMTDARLAQLLLKEEASEDPDDIYSSSRARGYGRPFSVRQKNVVTCTGTLIDVLLKPKAEWPLAVIYDANGGYTCSIDRTGARHDPMRPCSAGKMCRVTGIYQKFRDQTYAIETIINLNNFSDEQR
jgi:hypothetical protein